MGKTDGAMQARILRLRSKNRCSAQDARVVVGARKRNSWPLAVYLRLCHDLELLSLGQYAHVSKMVGEVGRLLGGWQKKLTETPQP
jgi:hypothetical protein